MTPDLLLTELRDALARLRAGESTAWSSASDAQLTALIEVSSSLRHEVDRYAALGAAEVVRRSRPELGLQGFAQRAGHRTVSEFLRSETGVTARDASTALRVATAVDLGGALGVAVADGQVSVAAADAIGIGLGAPSPQVPSELLDQAARQLCDEASTLDPDRLQKRAREVRDAIDETGVADREAARRGARSLRLVRQSDGMTRIIWVLDPESAAIVTDAYDRATSPRRGGPRFADEATRARAERLQNDDRSTEQVASDAFTELLRQSGLADTDVLVGASEPAVRVIVSAEALATGGHGVLESGESVAATTVHRLMCAGGVVPVVIDRAGQALQLGRAQRLFSRRQRQVLAVRDGGCRWPGCDRPPSWTEAHHILPWSEGGDTDVSNGILLCRHHHLRLHDEGWAVERRSGFYWLIPPPGSGKVGALLETKSRAVRELLSA